MKYRACRMRRPPVLRSRCWRLVSDQSFTLSSPNVYFEVGYGRGLTKRIIQTPRQGTPVEFDIRNWRTLFSENASELEAKLVSELIQAYRDVVSAA
jgi:hypothetical protein